MAKLLTEQNIKSIRKRINRGEHEDKIMSAENISRDDYLAVKDSYNPEATPETISKLKRDPLKGLERRGALNEYDLMAADMIRSAIQIRTHGLGTKCASVETRIDQKGRKATETESEWSIRVQEQYTLWHQLCVFEKPRIFSAPIIDILTEPVSLKDVDRDFGKANGWAREQLVRGLALYCDTFKPKISCYKSP